VKPGEESEQENGAARIRGTNNELNNRKSIANYPLSSWRSGGEELKMVRVSSCVVRVRREA
jgi:hypothetical protein